MRNKLADLPQTIIPLYSAIKKGETQTALLLVTELSPEQLVIQTKYGSTPLHIAIVFGNTEVSLALINKLSPIQLAIQNEDGLTPLHVAIIHENITIAEALIKNLSKEQVSIGRFTPMYLAIDRRNGKVAQLLNQKLDEKILPILQQAMTQPEPTFNSSVQSSTVIPQVIANTASEIELPPITLMSWVYSYVKTSMRVLD